MTVITTTILSPEELEKSICALIIKRCENKPIDLDDALDLLGSALTYVRKAKK